MDEPRARRLLTAYGHAASERVAAMTAELAQLAAAATDSNLDDEHDPEGSTVAFEREQLAALRAQASRQVSDAEDALRRLSTREYGTCERCGQPIGDERLDARPTARRCIECARRSAASPARPVPPGADWANSAKLRCRGLIHDRQ